MSLALRSSLGINRRVLGLAGRGQVVHQQIDLLGAVGPPQQVRHGGARLHSLGISQVLFQPTHPHPRTDLAQVRPAFGTRGRHIRHGMATDAIQLGEQDSSTLGRILPFAMKPVKTGNSGRCRQGCPMDQKRGASGRQQLQTHEIPRFKTGRLPPGTVRGEASGGPIQIASSLHFKASPTSKIGRLPIARQWADKNQAHPAGVC